MGKAQLLRQAGGADHPAGVGELDRVPADRRGERDAGPVGQGAAILRRERAPAGRKARELGDLVLTHRAEDRHAGRVQRRPGEPGMGAANVGGNDLEGHR